MIPLSILSLALFLIAAMFYHLWRTSERDKQELVADRERLIHRIASESGIALSHSRYSTPSPDVPLTPTKSAFRFVPDPRFLAAMDEAETHARERAQTAANNVKD